MTMKICRQKFWTRMEILEEILKGFAIILAYFSFVAGVIAIFYGVFFVENQMQGARYIIIGLLPALFGGMITLMDLTMNDRLQILNEKLHLFEWRDDC